MAFELERKDMMPSPTRSSAAWCRAAVSPGPATVHARVEDGWGSFVARARVIAAIALLSLTAALLRTDGDCRSPGRRPPAHRTSCWSSPTISGSTRSSDAQRPGAGGGRDDAPPGDRDQRAVLSLTGDDPHRPVLAHHRRVLQRRSRGRVERSTVESDTIATALDRRLPDRIDQVPQRLLRRRHLRPTGLGSLVRVRGEERPLLRLSDVRRRPRIVEHGSAPRDYSTDVSVVCRRRS